MMGLWDSFGIRCSVDGHSPEIVQQPFKGKEKMADIVPDSENCASQKDDSVPQVGMVFQSEGSAYEFYNAYAQRVGFTVRLGKVERLRDGTIRKRFFLCIKQGCRENSKRLNEGNQEKDHERLNAKKVCGDTKTDCKARMCIKMEKDGTWVVNEFIFEHNHPLGTPSSVYLLRPQMQALPSQGSTVDRMDGLGIRCADGFGKASGEARESENSGILDVDRNHLWTKRMKSLREGDGQILLDYFKKMQLENSSFFYAVQLDKDRRVTNYFWVDAKSMMNYSYFGDVVCFDTTFQTTNYELPFAPFMGMNHHKQIILFGAALLLDETTNSFVWLFETWMNAMSGRHPKTILTDQCAEIEKAVALVFPETRHRLCLRQMVQNASKNLSYMSISESNFLHEFKSCIYASETEEDLQSCWDIMLKRYKLVGNKWLEGLYEAREKWALAYGRDSFCADLATTCQMESINDLFTNYLDRNLPLSKFVSYYELALINQFEKELHEDCNSKESEPTLCVDVPMLKQAAKEYTKNVFEMFQEEYKKWPCCNVESCGQNGTAYSYNVTQFGQLRECLVMFDTSNSTVTCSCKKFEFVGILCRHVLKVLNHKNIFDLPTRYILKRWTKDAKSNVGFVIQADCQEFVSLRYSELCNKAIAIATKAKLTEGAHSVATRGLDKLLEQAEAVLKRVSAQKPQTSTSVQSLKTKKRKKRTK